MSFGPSEYAVVFSVALARLFALTTLTAVASHGVLHLTGRPGKLRSTCLVLLLVAYHGVLFVVLSRREVLFLGLVFVGFHFGFVFRFISSIVFYRGPAPPPSLGFHVALLVAGPWQHYGAGEWSDLEGNRLGSDLLKKWTLHTAYNLGAIVVILLLLWLSANFRFPLRSFFIRAGFFLLGLEGLAITMNLTFMAWAPWGRHQTFFSNFTWLRSTHIGEFWRNWNVVAVEAFREYSRWLGLRRHYFLNVMVVFLISGILHQIMMYYFTRQLSYGTLLSFLIHGFLVYVFGRLYRVRKRLPAPLRIAMFNQATTAVVVMAASQPLILDLYGRFPVPLP